MDQQKQCSFSKDGRHEVDPKTIYSADADPGGCEVKVECRWCARKGSIIVDEKDISWP
jgi:hypothetical protein